MNKDITLIVMAAGMGSRFGGLKQIAPIGKNGEILLDYSVYDAVKAGFNKVVFVIKHAIEQDFKAVTAKHIEKMVKTEYVFQEIDGLPEGFTCPADRTKPWGTAHAVACCRGVVEGPFAVINSDDFYGRGAYEAIFRFLTESEAPHHYAMLGYQLRNTVTEFGSVARGVCHVQDGMLLDITERTKIFKRGQDAAYTEDGETFVPLSGDTQVSMNFWGFTPEILDEIWNAFPAFLAENLPVNPEKCEFYLPTFVGSRLAEKKVSVRVLPCMETWHGVTYKEDLDSVKSAIGALKREGKYPARLWE